MNRNINLSLPEYEYQRLAAYSNSLGLTETEVLREFIRSLPEVAESEPLPEGWVQENDGWLSGQCLSYKVNLFPDCDTGNYEVYLNDELVWKGMQNLSSTQAIAVVPKIIRTLEKMELLKEGAV